MAQDAVVGSQTVKSAFLTNVNGDISELFTDTAANLLEITNARVGEATLVAKVTIIDTGIAANLTEITNARVGEATLLAKQQSQDTAIAALAAGSGVVVSADDTTAGFLNGKLVEGSQISFTENNPGGDETLTVAVSSTYQAALTTAFEEAEAFSAFMGAS